MKKIRVLSIDFDYFQNASLEALNEYPDGIDQSTEISAVIWGIRYADKTISDILRSVSIRQDEIDKMKDIISYQKVNIPVMIANSHKHIYDFICNNAPDDSRLSVVNVDMHHDLYNENTEIDCGNWLNFIHQKYGANYMWICNPISKEVYGFKEEDASHNKKSLAEILPDKLDILKNKSFDMVFLCCSDIWTPPHLDSSFTELCDAMKNHFNEIKIEKGITQPRNISKFEKNKQRGKNVYEYN